MRRSARRVAVRISVRVIDASVIAARRHRRRALDLPQALRTRREVACHRPQFSALAASRRQTLIRHVQRRHP
jgi:hypothetical protein